MKEAFLLLTLLAFPISSLAQENETCEGAMTTYDISMCFSRILKKVERELNSTYQRALTLTQRDYTARDVQNLRFAERRWMAYRVAACNAEYELWGFGSGGPAAHTGCLIKIAKQRIADLKEAYLMSR
jgi:uncharacterized protein YecT (DUF1311 family)